MTADVKKVVVLVVDGSGQRGNLIETELLRRGFEVDIATETDEAKYHLLSRRHSLIICDFDVDCKKGGLDFLMWIRDDSPYKDIQFLLCVPTDSPDIRQAVKDIGARFHHKGSEKHVWEVVAEMLS